MTSIVTSLRAVLARTTRGAPQDLLPALQDALKALADVEVHYTARRERLNAWPGPEEAKQKLSARLDEHHRRAREGLVRRVDELERRITAARPRG